MRPTIPLSAWKIAVSLAETRAMQQHPAMPATHCSCECCANWRQVHAEVLPVELEEQLRRLGIAPQSPSDAYGQQLGSGLASFRASYYVVGKVLEGPSGWSTAADGRQARQYTTIATAPYGVGLAVQYQDQFFDVAPLVPAESGKLIQIDFRMEVPWRVGARR